MGLDFSLINQLVTNRPFKYYNYQNALPIFFWQSLNYSRERIKIWNWIRIVVKRGHHANVLMNVLPKGIHFTFFVFVPKFIFLIHPKVVNLQKQKQKTTYAL